MRAPSVPALPLSERRELPSSKRRAAKATRPNWWTRASSRLRARSQGCASRSPKHSGARLAEARAHSSAGERPLHTREVPGSIPGVPITQNSWKQDLFFSPLSPREARSQPRWKDFGKPRRCARVERGDLCRLERDPRPSNPRVAGSNPARRNRESPRKSGAFRCRQRRGRRGGGNAGGNERRKAPSLSEHFRPPSLSEHFRALQSTSEHFAALKPTARRFSCLALRHSSALATTFRDFHLRPRVPMPGTWQREDRLSAWVMCAGMSERHTACCSQCIPEASVGGRPRG
jgi:hypothetical protein